MDTANRRITGGRGILRIGYLPLTGIPAGRGILLIGYHRLMKRYQLGGVSSESEGRPEGGVSYGLDTPANMGPTRQKERPTHGYPPIMSGFWVWAPHPSLDLQKVLAPNTKWAP